MKQKLLACDVDGTLLLGDEQYIDTKDLNAIKKFREAGHLFALCTGRTLVWTLPLIKAYDLVTDALILCNGSMIYKTNPHNMLDVKEIGNCSIPNKIGLEIIEYFYYLQDYILYWDDGIQTYEIQDRLLSKVSSIIQENYSIHLTITDALNLKSDFVTIGVTPVSIDTTIAEKIKKYILERWGNYITAFRNQYFIDIAPKDSSKGVGITYLQNYLQNPMLETFCVGDSFNDFPMFESVGKDRSFLMANGEQDLKAYVSQTVTSVAECIDIILSQ